MENTEREILHSISRYILTHGYPPTIQEIAKDCFISYTHAYRCLAYLEYDGYICRQKNTPRGIKIIKP
jgi:SOS-response transcriptional repressor LexA